MIDIHFDLGNHNVLLETNYDLWAWTNYLGSLPTSNKPTGSHTIKGLGWVLSHPLEWAFIYIDN